MFDSVCSYLCDGTVVKRRLIKRSVSEAQLVRLAQSAGFETIRIGAVDAIKLLAGQFFGSMFVCQHSPKCEGTR